MSLKLSFLFATLGYATHGLLDACTTYGTLLLWPISNTRFAWNSVSVVDPLFTVPLFILILLSLVRKNSRYGKVALSWALIYLLFGFYQRNRAEAFASEELTRQGVSFNHLSAKPSFGNLFVWKIVSNTKEEFNVDAVRVGFEKTFFKGETIKKLNLERDFPSLPRDSVQAHDIERFRWFSDDYLAVSKSDSTLVVDIRYSMVPNEIAGLWGIRIDPTNSNKHVVYEVFRDTSAATRAKFWRLLF